ncbi:MAG: GNAT family N-acetyltransferase [candidate division WOR-3 bacterium]
MALIIRPARPSDRLKVVAISRRIWQGHDYLPLFFNRWIREGNFWVAELGHVVVGCAKATQLAPGEWWLEGLRVDPNQQGRGIGREISERVLQLTLTLRPKTLRLATANVNKASIRIINRMGFRLLSRHWFLVGPARGRASGVRLRRPKPDEAFTFIAGSSEYQAAAALMPYTWMFQQITPEYITELCGRGFVRAWPGRGRLEGIIVVRPHRYFPRDLDISFVHGTGPALAAFRQHLQALARRRGSRRISAMPASRAMFKALTRLGLKREEGIRHVLVYEYPTRTGR